MKKLTVAQKTACRVCCTSILLWWILSSKSAPTAWLYRSAISSIFSLLTNNSQNYQTDSNTSRVRMILVSSIDYRVLLNTKPVLMPDTNTSSTLRQLSIRFTKHSWRETDVDLQPSIDRRYVWTIIVAVLLEQWGTETVSSVGMLTSLDGDESRKNSRAREKNFSTRNFSTRNFKFIFLCDKK